MQSKNPLSRSYFFGFPSLFILWLYVHEMNNLAKHTEWSKNVLTVHAQEKLINSIERFTEKNPLRMRLIAELFSREKAMRESEQKNSSVFSFESTRGALLKFFSSPLSLYKYFYIVISHGMCFILLFVRVFLLFSELVYFIFVPFFSFFLFFYECDLRHVPNTHTLTYNCNILKRQANERAISLISFFIFGF